jgi:SNARE protein
VDKIPPIYDRQEKIHAIDRAKKRLRGAAGTKRSFKMEIRLVQDVNLRRKFESRLNSLDSQLKTLQADVKALEAETQRGDLFGGGGADPDDPESNMNDGVKAGDKMLAEASNLQDKTQDSLANTMNMISSSKEVGVATLEELERQRDVLYSIDREVDRVDDGLARAEALLKQFGKRMASDHFIQCFALINCLLLCGVVLFAIIKKGGLSTSKNATPKTPV